MSIIKILVLDNDADLETIESKTHFDALRGAYPGIIFHYFKLSTHHIRRVSGNFGSNGYESKKKLALF